MDGTKTVHVVFATATAAANGQNVGDISAIIPEGLAVSLQSNVEAAASLCSALLRKRDDEVFKRVTEEGKIMKPLLWFVLTAPKDSC